MLIIWLWFVVKYLCVKKKKKTHRNERPCLDPLSTSIFKTMRIGLK